MAKVSISIMAHPSRKTSAEAIAEKVGLPKEQIVWDRKNDRWDTGRRAWEAHDPDADWHLVLQDDILVCEDLHAGIEKAADRIPREAIASLYVGTRRPLAAKVDDSVKQARFLGASWIVMQSLNWGVGIMAPTGTINDMLVWCDGEDYPNYDRRVGRYYLRQMSYHTWCTWPSLIDHTDTESLCGHGDGRVAHQFIGESASALTPTWGGPVVHMLRGRNGLTSEQRKFFMEQLRAESRARRQERMRVAQEKTRIRRARLVEEASRVTTTAG